MANHQTNPIAAVAKQFVLDLEKKHVFLNNFAELESFLNPRSPLEEHLARYIAISAWRVARLVTLEKAIFDRQIDKESGNHLPVALGANAYMYLADNSRVLDLMGRAEARAFKALKDGLNLFFKVREQQFLANNLSPERTILQ